MSTTPSGLVSPATPSGSPDTPEPSTPLPPARPPDTIPTFITPPPAPTTIPPVWEHVISVLTKMPPTTAERQNMRAWVLYHSLTSLDDFLKWELDTLQYDAVTVCFPSRDPSQPNSLVSLKPTPLGISSCSGSISTTWFKTHTSLWPLMPQTMSSSLPTSYIPPSTNSCHGNSMRSPPHLLHLHLLSLPLDPRAAPPPWLQSTPELQERNHKIYLCLPYAQR